MVAILISPILVCLLALVAVDAAPAKRAGGFPDFVLKYAPLSNLHSKEQYWPSDVKSHLTKVTPQINFKTVGPTPTLQTLSSLTNDVSLTANDNILKHNTQFFTTPYGKPAGSGLSGAPGTIIVVEKSGGIIDAFYFCFYSWNYGNEVLGLRYGNHVGDWEHTMVRFVNGVPDTVFFSAHSGGFAYKYSALEKDGVRPIGYIATGTHANYATAGDHPYSLPLGLLKDQTNKGPRWDITQNFRGFWYNPSTGAIDAAPGAGSGGDSQPGEGTSWLNFGGQWGDKQWPTSRLGQYCLFDQCNIVGGPSGPLSKNLGRTAVCQNESNCPVKDTVPKVESIDELSSDGGI